jgi:D-beta-D-heptose 7-phosphate kinase/D-beta-D-heptose 1-phosphate adenosyltransferase
MADRVNPDPAPLLDAGALEEFLGGARARSLRLVFTNGCFDLIHPGHVAYLAEARALGDLLLVGLNSDASVRRLKGPGRPLIPQEGRFAVLASLRCVDGVVVFEEDTPRDLILRVRPRFLVKGGDYTPAEVVGARELAGWGGELVLLPFRSGYSTSELVRSIRNLKGDNQLSA